MKNDILAGVAIGIVALLAMSGFFVLVALSKVVAGVVGASLLGILYLLRKDG